MPSVTVNQPNRVTVGLVRNATGEVTVRSAGLPSIKLNQTASGLLTQSSDRISIQQPLTRNKFAELADVDVSAVADGDTIVYEADTNKYVARELTLGDLADIIDGGTF